MRTPGDPFTVWTGVIQPGTTIAVPVPIILREGQEFSVDNTSGSTPVTTFGCGSLLLGDPT